MMTQLIKTLKKNGLKIDLNRAETKRFLQLQKMLFDYYNSEVQRAIADDLPNEYVKASIQQMEAIVKVYDNAIEMIDELGVQ